LSGALYHGANRAQRSYTVKKISIKLLLGTMLLAGASVQMQTRMLGGDPPPDCNPFTDPTCKGLAALAK